MRNKWFLISIILILSVFALAACGNNEGDQAAEDKEEPKTEEKQETEDKASEKEASNENAEYKAEELGGEVNLYTGRHYETDQELYDQFTEETGIEVNVIKGDDDELIARLDREGKASKADLLITADAGRLHRAKSQDLLQSVDSDVLNANIPENLRDEEQQWFGLTKRARVIAYHKERVNPEDIQTYMDLTKDEFQDKVLIRSSSNIYNQSLVASMIALDGEEKAKEWAEGIVDNMARDPKGGDTDQAKAVAAGEGDVAVMNTYYLGKLMNSEDPEEVKVGEQLGVIFPNQDSTGAHVNISGIGMTASSKNTEQAQKFIEFLTTEQAQKQFAEANYEYPVNPDVAPSELLQSWGEFKAQDINLSVLGENNDKAIKVMNEVGWQ
ncbi:extracellular solute-binding protein [Halobacillus yeomjeoni]|uniref:Fe(3+) ABC transporter substrate-binding protein n=1 Tax=Halobacillus yeomjeoni TaxID=311194 RepID=UPI001CD6EDE6|nr:Fe(3+) ABC transporter substrate-binding protein [Halobacillus yeomjeoni]MCA0985365.1 extracellular solute-binding protein [Halobacillus yeomjeoni]